MCQGRGRAAKEGPPHCHGQRTGTQGCRERCTPWGLCKPLQRGCSLAPPRGLKPYGSLPTAPVYPAFWRLGGAGFMRHIQMDTSPMEEAGGESSQSSSADPSHGQSGVLSAGQDCRVVVGYPEKEHKLQKVYHVSITSEVPGPKAVGRQALKRGPPDQPLEPARSPRRALWGPSKSEVTPGHLQADGDYLSGPLVEDEEDQDIFEDGLLSEEMPMCSSAQHFYHSGLHVIEHRSEGFPSKDASGRRVTAPPIAKVGLKRLDSPSPPPCTTLHRNTLTETQLGNSEGLSVPSETNGTNISIEAKNSEETTSHQHILDIILHNIAHPETSTEKLEDISPSCSHGFANGNLATNFMALEGTTKESSFPCEQDQTLQSPDVEDPKSLERTPPGFGRICPSGSSNMAVKRKLLPSAETGESCSEEEGHSKRWRGGESCQALHGSCRSTDSKAAPFWNHLLPTARNSPKSPTDCTGRRLKRGLRLKTRTLRSVRRGAAGRSCTGSWASSYVSRSLLGNFEESILRGRFAPSGQIEGFTAEIGASGSYCPQHVTLPVEVTYFHISEHSAPSPFLGVIDLDAVGRKGYSVPSTGTIQVTLFNPNKTVVKMFLVTYDFTDMPANHVTFLRHRIFLVPVQENDGECDGQDCTAKEKAKRILCYLMHLRFHRSKHGKIYLNEDIRLLFSRKSIEVDTGIPYELKSFTEAPKNPKYSPRV